ncbi:hypothetical protein HKX48_007054 [Thoreauomyces humboldtii]|nr:hypothetical protein HKX48_007054 [Thoreauomyces humboldtii]
MIPPRALRVVSSLLVPLLAIWGFTCLSVSSPNSLQVAGLRPTSPLKELLHHFDAPLSRKRLSQAIRTRTVAKIGTEWKTADDEIFYGFQRQLESNFPLVHQTLKWEVLNEFDIFLTWEGSEPDAADRLPILFCAHQDVVPVNPELWDFSPFSGAMENGFIYGRGTLDMKGMLIAELSAIETLIKAGWQPKRTLHFAFGHDEEISHGVFTGNQTVRKSGAETFQDLFRERGLRFEFVLDEGLPIATGMFPGMKGPIAFIGMAEKTPLDITIRSKSLGGHGSMPFSENAIHILAEAVAKVAAFHPTVTVEKGPVGDLLRTMAPEHPWYIARIILSMPWLVQRIIPWVPARLFPGFAAMTRTTLASTIIHGGVGQNVLPTDAYAIVNCRIRPGESGEDVIRYVAKAIGARVIDHGDEVVQVEGKDADSHSLTVSAVTVGTERWAVSSPDTRAYRVLAGTIRHVYSSDAGIREPTEVTTTTTPIVVPSLLMGATDGGSYVDFTDSVFRFQPIRMQPEDLTRIHGINERISVKDFDDMCMFFACLMMNADDM